MIKKIIGIYKITNLINQKFYIGCSNDILKRWKEHIKGSHSIYLCRAIKKYGVNNFKFEVLEETTILEKYNREKYWLEKLKPVYNIIQSIEGVYYLTDEVKQKISEAKKGKKRSKETRKKIGEGNKGKKLSKETKQKISKANKGENNHNWKGGISKDMKAYMNAYKQTPKYKAYMNAYMKAYQQTPKYKAYNKARQQTPKWKAYMKAYYRTPKYKAYKKAYNKDYRLRLKRKITYHPKQKQFNF